MLEASSDSEAGPLTLASIALDLQITICTLLHPSDIIALRQTCKALQLATRQRIVWVAALHQVCLDDSLFLPSFPIHEMSDVELEHAAMAPHRWIELCASFEKQHLNDSGAKLCPRTTRIIEISSSFHHCDLFIVPGGRYLVGYSEGGIFVWDLGYTSNADCKLIASVGPEGGSTNCCIVQATQDGVGLIILSSRKYDCSVYEIYPQSERPQLTLIARPDLDYVFESHPYLLHNRLLWFDLIYGGGRIVFTVWDYRKNHSITFSADVDNENIYFLQVIATKMAIIALCKKKY